MVLSCFISIFIEEQKGQPNETRKKVIFESFMKFDTEGCGVITVEDLIGVYDCSKYPRVTSGEITERQALEEFLENFALANKTGQITLDVKTLEGPITKRGMSRNGLIITRP